MRVKYLCGRSKRIAEDDMMIRWIPLWRGVESACFINRNYGAFGEVARIYRCCGNPGEC